MQNQDPSQTNQISFPKASDSDLIQRLSDENYRLRQIIDEITNRLAIQQELIQQLRDEIAILKGQKPKPKIPPSKLEGPSSKLDWRKRIGPLSYQIKSVVFSSWVNDLTRVDIPFLHHYFSVVITVSILQAN